MADKIQKTTEQSSFLAFYLSKAGYHFSKISKILDKKESVHLLNEASLIAKAGGFAFLGADGLISLMKYIQLSQKKDLKDYEVKIKNTLLADIGVKLAASATGLTYVFGEKGMKEVLKASHSVGGLSASLVSSLFLASYALLIGTNVIRAYIVNTELKQQKTNRDNYLSTYLSDDYQAMYQNLEEDDKQKLIESLISNQPLQTKNSDLETIGRGLSQKNIPKNELIAKHKKVNDLRFKRNNYLQMAGIYGFCLGVSLAMIVFPPSTLIIAAVAFAGVSFKIGWDFYQSNEKNKEDKRLENLKDNDVIEPKDDNFNKPDNEALLENIEGKWHKWEKKYQALAEKRDSDKINEEHKSVVETDLTCYEQVTKFSDFKDKFLAFKDTVSSLEVRQEKANEEKRPSLSLFSGG